MTPTQSAALAVALDQLREAGLDDLTLGRIQRAIKPDVEVALVALSSRFLEPTERREIRFDGQPFERYVIDFQAGSLGSVHALAKTIVDEFERLSPPENATGASTPQPQGETASPHEGLALSPDPSSWRCYTCGYHACVCDSFPGAGAG